MERKFLEGLDFSGSISTLLRSGLAVDVDLK